jgi:hypothetical protein
MEGRYLQLMVERADGMFVERFCGKSGISILEGVIDTFCGEAVNVGEAAPLMAGIQVRCPIEKPVAMQD